MVSYPGFDQKAPQKDIVFVLDHFYDEFSI